MNSIGKKRLWLCAVLMCMALALTGCVGARMGVSWPSVSLVELDGSDHIAIAYNNELSILTPANGAPARLISPINGQPLRDNDNNPRTWTLRGSDNDGSQFYSAPLRLDEETLLVADNNRRLLKVDSVIAEVARSIPLADKVVADPLVAGGLMILPYQNGGISARSLQDLQEVWSFPTEEGVWAQPLLAGDMVIIAGIDHNLYALRLETGQLLWSLDLGGSVASRPLLANDRLYVGSFNKSFYEISLDGIILSHYETQNWVWGSPAIDEYNIVYVADLSGFVHALDTESGLMERWSRQIAERGIRAGPLVYQDRVFVASRDGKVYWLDRRDGELINAREIDERPELLGDMMLLEPSETLQIDEPLLLVTSVHDARLLIAFGIDGRQTWVYPR